jgi:predicted acyltransferase
MSPSAAQTREAAAERAPDTAPQRLVSLDAFRGLTIALMVLVNNNGSGRDAYFQLRHSAWHGWTLTDTVFPTFVWIVGVAITLSLGKRLSEGVPKSKLITQICRRFAILFFLGLVCYAFPHFNLSTQRILGVLQRIAICYFAASLLFLFTKIRGQICCIIGLLAVYWALMTYAPVPGYGAGRFDVAGNFAHYVDHLVLGSHNYAETKDWDPEGLVSTLPAIATALLGVLAGHLLRLKRSLRERLAWFVAVGIALLAAGLIWNSWMPINKKIWTDSFCLFMAGLDFVVFAAFAWLVDVMGWRRPVKPFVILGMNSIVIYMVSEFAAEILDAFGWQQPVYRSVFVPLASPANASLLYSLAFVASMYVVAWPMYRRRWFVRI